MDEETKNWLKKKVKEIDAQEQVAEKAEAPEQTTEPVKEQGEPEIDVEKSADTGVKEIPEESLEDHLADSQETEPVQSEEHSHENKPIPNIGDIMAPDHEPVIAEKKGMNWKMIIIMAAMGSAAGVAAFLVYKFLL